MPNFAGYGPCARAGGSKEVMRPCNTNVKKKIGKARKLGKWQTGYNGILTQKYIDWRRMRRRMASKSRSRNRN